MSKCRVRLILWLILAGTSIAGGIIAALILRTELFPALVRVLGLVGMVLAYFPLNEQESCSSFWESLKSGDAQAD